MPGSCESEVDDVVVRRSSGMVVFRGRLKNLGERSAGVLKWVTWVEM